MTGSLVIADGRRVAAEDGLTIGRSADCGLVLADTKASRHHARIVVEGGVTEIEDMGSSNGTLLNGKAVRRRVLRDGDVLQIGTTFLTFEESAAPAGRAAPERPARTHGPHKRPSVAADDDVDLFAEEPPPASPREPRQERPPPGTHAAPPPAAPTEPPEADEPPQPPAGEAQPPAGTPQPPAGRTQPPAGRTQPPAGRTQPPAAGTPPPQPLDVVEFEDEVVEVRRPPRAPSEPTRGPTAEPEVQRQQSTLHYSPHSREPSGGGVMRDDLAQMSAWQRNLLVVLAVAVAVGLGYLAMVLARG